MVINNNSYSCECDFINNNSSTYSATISLIDNSIFPEDIIGGNVLLLEYSINEVQNDTSTEIRFCSVVVNDNIIPFGEEYDDVNNNYCYDEGEPFIDTNTNGIWDPSTNYISKTINLLGLLSESDNDTYLPNRFDLKQNYPNPFNPLTNISFNVPQYGEIIITIVNIEGKVINNLINDKFYPGKYSVIWDGTDKNGNIVPSGIYYYQMQTNNFIKSKKLVLIK